MTSLVPVVAAAIAALAATFRFLARLVIPAGPRTAASVESVEAIPVERYEPMLRLLERDDLRFLQSHPGCRRGMAARLRRQRCRLFQGYLRNLTSDFQQTCAALRIIMLRSGCDRPDLAKALLHAQKAFAFGLLTVGFRLMLYSLGWSTVDATGLVRLFGSMQLELRGMLLEGMPAPA